MNLDIKETVTSQAQKASLAARKLAVISSADKNKALMAMATALENKTQLNFGYFPNIQVECPEVWN